MKRTDELSKFDICCISQIYAKYFLILVVLGSVLLSATPASAITVDGYKSVGEWDENWFYGQENASDYNPDGPFGDRLVIRQGGYKYPLVVTDTWYDTDPKNDSGSGFDQSMATLGVSSGFDIANIYAHYDPLTDTVYGLTEVYGIPGDVDGNGNVSTQSPADKLGAVGPAGSGLGNTEFWNLRMIQDDIATDISLINNNWTVLGNGLQYDDIEVKFTSDQTNSVYEISFRNISEHYSVAPGAVLAMQLLAGSSADGLGEDAATVFISIPLGATIGDYVWSDTNNDGLQNVSESGIPGVLVDLVRDGTIISTDTTDADGLYLFDNLVADCYDVVINSSNFESGGALVGHIASPANAGSDDTIDSDGINNASSACVNPGDVNLTIDFGYVPLGATIGDYVWSDTNNDGLQNVSEPGISGVLIDLVLDGTIISTDTTDADGLYLFDNLVADCYDVVINSSNFESGGALVGHIASPANAGSDDTIDSDGINNASSACVNPGDVNLTIDFGYYKPCISGKARIGDYVWEDVNKNGIQNDGEPGIPCVVVDLVHDGSIISTTVTNKCGFYLFDNIMVDCTTVSCYDVVINSSNFESCCGSCCGSCDGNCCGSCDDTCGESCCGSCGGTCGGSCCGSCDGTCVSCGVLYGYIASPPNVGMDDEIDSDGIDNRASVCVSAGDENFTIDFGFYKVCISECDCDNDCRDNDCDGKNKDC